MASIISAGTTSGTSLNLSGDTSGVLQLASNGSTTAVTIDTSQNVGIGTTSPVSDARLTISSPTTESYVFFQRSNSTFFDAAIGNNGGSIVFRGGADSATVAGLTEFMRITSAGLLQFNSGYGSVATAYGCRAWVNFNGTGTVAIRASGNVTSITDNGTGDYTVNFTNAITDANYAATFGVKSATGVGTTQVEIPTSGGDPTTSALRINTVFVAGSPANNRTAIDAAIINVAVFR
jgi:hypothetical protein